MKRESVEELFYIRAICAFGIFMIHLSGAFAVSSSYGSRAMHLGILINQFFRFGTPVFIMISGFVLFYNYRSFMEFDCRKFYTKKIKYVLIPYLIWSSFYLILAPYLIWSSFYFIFSNCRVILSQGNISLIEFLKNVTLGNAYPHLYFIFLIFQFYLLYPLFLKYFIKHMEKTPVLFFVICLIVQGIILSYEFFFKAYGGNGLIDFFNKYYWKSIFGWFYYFLTGGVAALHYKKITDFIEKNIWKIVPIYVISTTLYIGEVYLNIWKEEGRTLYERYGSIRPMTIIYASFTMIILIWIGRKIGRSKHGYKQIIKTCGIYSLGIYLIHPFVLEVLKIKLINRFSNFLGYSRISSMVILVVIGWICTVSLILLLSNLKWGMFVIGKVPKYQSMFIKYIKGKNQDRAIN